MTDPQQSPLDPEDAKIITLARTARTRAYAEVSGRPEGAAVRDTDGRTYAAATVDHPRPDLSTTALRGALVAAVSSGVRTFEAAALVTAEDPTGLPGEDDRALLAEFAVPVLHVADPRGTHLRSVSL